MAFGVTGIAANTVENISGNIEKNEVFIAQKKSTEKKSVSKTTDDVAVSEILKKDFDQVGISKKASTFQNIFSHFSLSSDSVQFTPHRNIGLNPVRDSNYFYFSFITKNKVFNENRLHLFSLRTGAGEIRPFAYSRLSSSGIRKAVDFNSSAEHADILSANSYAFSMPEKYNQDLTAHRINLLKRRPGLTATFLDTKVLRLYIS